MEYYDWECKRNKWQEYETKERKKNRYNVCLKITNQRKQNYKNGTYINEDGLIGWHGND